jgi:hypothetical protein
MFYFMCCLCSLVRTLAVSLGCPFHILAKMRGVLVTFCLTFLTVPVKAFM